MKKSIFLFFAAILCATSAWAHNLAANQYVYFEKPSDWEAAQLLIGKSDWSEGYTMTNISNTNLYYLKTIKWDGYTEYYFFEKKDKWGGEGKSPTNRTPWTGKTSSKYTSAIAKCHLFNSTKSIKSSTTSTTAYATVVNRTQTIKVQLKDGSNWEDATVVPADLTASTYALTSATAAGAKSASLTKESTTVSATVDAAYSAKVTLSCTNVLDGYMFEGWYDANGNKITSYTVSDAHTVYARFIQSAEETNEVSVTYMCGTTSVATAISETVGVESEKSFTAPTVTGYKFTNWTIGAGIDLKVGTASDATITIVTKSASSDYSLVANYEEVIETIYFINTGKWSVVNLHRWNGTATASAWPGTPLTASGEKIGEYDVYSFTAKQGDFANVIFTNKNTGSDQTADLTWTAGKYYIYNYGTNTGWYTKAEAEALLVTPVVTHDIVVKAVVPEAWTSTTIGIHYWGDGISATSNPVATEKDGNWNKYTIKNVPEGASVNVIFLNGTSWPDDKSKQTANITGITEDKCFQISAKTLDGEGKCTYAVVDCTADIKPEGDVYTIMGAGELGLSWNLGTTGNDMTKQADGTYTLVKEGLDLATTGNYEYKVVKNHSWDWSIPSGNTNQKLTVDKDGTYTITFTLSADKKKLTADAKCTAEKEVILDCFVAGTTNLVGGTTDFTDELPMTYDEGTKTYSKTFIALAAGNYQMKVVYGSDWLGYDKLTTPVPANVTKGDDNKIKFSLAEAGDVTVTYHATNGIGLAGNFAVPETKYYIAGTENLTGFDWKENGLEILKDGDVYKHTFSEMNAGTYEFKITDGTWTNSWGFDNLAANYVGVEQGKDGEGNPNGNIKIVTEEAKNIIVIFDLANNKITLKDWAIVTHTYTIAGDAALCGEAWNWELAANDMTNNGDGTYTWTKAGVEVNGELSFKVFVDYKSEPAYPSENWVIKPENYEGVGVYDVIITFTESSKEVVVALTKQAVVTPTLEVIRTGLTDGQWGTLCPTQNVEDPTGATFYQIAYLEEKDGLPFNMHFYEVEGNLEAGQPYFFIASASEIKGVKSGEVKTAGDNANGFYGYIGAEAWTLPYQESFDVNNDNTFVIWNNSVFRINAETSIKSERCYIIINKTQPSRDAVSVQAGARRITMGVSGINGQNTATGMENVDASAQPVKAIINGQLFILRGEKMYDAQGKLVK